MGSLVGGERFEFQCFSNYRNIYNTIRELRDVEGTKVQGFSDLASLGVKNFHSLF